MSRLSSTLQAESNGRKDTVLSMELSETDGLALFSFDPLDNSA